MQIADLKIQNFRGIRDGYIRFGTHTLFVGPNGCGKTTVIEALALLFGRDRMVRTLTEHDFFGGDPQPADRIRLVATITNFDGDDPADYPDWFRDDRAVPKWWNTATSELSPIRTDPTWRLACQIGLCARFDRPSLEVETVRYFHDDDAVADIFVDEVWAAVPSRLIRDIGLFLVPASRTWDRVISFGSELFRRVVASGDGQPAESVLAERDRLRAPQQPLEADPRLAPIIAQLNAELAGFLRSEPRLSLRVTTTDSEGLLDAVMPHYAHAGAGHALPARRHGSGLISLQHLLLLLQFGRQRAAAGEEFWMALEEPELHVPPPLQRRLVHRIQALSTQTFVTTHSPMVAAFSDPRTILILRNNGGQLLCVPLLTDALQANAPNSIRKLFQINRILTISALMHEVVLVPEGRLDYEWLTLLVHAVDLHQGWGPAAESQFGACVGVIPTHDAAITASVAALSRLHPRIAAVVDGDAAGEGYADALVAEAIPPAVILQWPDNWTIEDVVGWILEANLAESLGALSTVIDPPPATLAELVERLKSDDRTVHGLKQDQVAYEVIADVIGSVEACWRRARELLNSITDVVTAIDNPRFLANPERPEIKIFQP